MGRKRKFDKTKAVTFKLQYRSNDDPTYKEGGLLSDRIFSLIEPPKSKEHKLDPEARQRIVSQFTKEDMGIIDEKAARKLKKEKLLKQKARGAASGALPAEIAAKLKNRDDLWITHLNRQKIDQELNEIEEAERKERKAQKAKNPSATQDQEEDSEEDEDEDDGDDEDWEDDGDDEEDDDDEEEWASEDDNLEDEEMEYEEDEDNDEDYEDVDEEEEFEHEEADMDEEEFQKLYGNEAPQLVDPTTVTEAKTNEKTVEPKKEKKKKELDPDADLDFKNLELAPGVRTKRYDENGLPLDGYDYYQHICDPDKGGAPDFVYYAQYKEVPKIVEDIDVEYEKLTPEQREVLAALDVEDDAAYEDLEDDFIGIVTGGQAAVVEKAAVKPADKKKQKAAQGDDEMEISYDKSGVDKPTKKQVQFAAKPIVEEPKPKEKEVKVAAGAANFHSKKDFMNIVKQHAEKMRQRFLDTGTVMLDPNEIGKNAQTGASLSKKSHRIPNVPKEERESSSSEDEEANVEPLHEVERLDYKNDHAMQAMMARSSDSEEESDEREDMNNKEESETVDTVASRSFISAPNPALTIIKEDKIKRNKVPKKGAKREKNGDEEDSESEDEEEEQNVSVVQDIFTKREKGLTAEEKKARKQAIKEFKTERRTKKQTFKVTFDNEKKKHLERHEKQAGASNPRGFSTYKL